MRSRKLKNNHKRSRKYYTKQSPHPNNFYKKKEEHIYRPNQECWVDEKNYLHREDGPAFIELKVQYPSPPNIRWYKHGALHRLDGPAVTVGSTRESYYIEGIEYTKEHYCSIMNNIDKENRDDVLLLGKLF